MQVHAAQVGNQRLTVAITVLVQVFECGVQCGRVFFQLHHRLVYLQAAGAAARHLICYKHHYRIILLVEPLRGPGGKIVCNGVGQLGLGTYYQREKKRGQY
ncbi:hypothetical protein F0L74_15720 [Chitinophaga agrisoli]|uniref:Uncharacterized protein n=1 Tax=Chitinophaga agrisoli TaxID=2607653 RepID=A0A5B2VSS9_9BACT|nr:hypothetical protein F0L74_15720 [Chitinophaga agrisoli]